ncbi:MAG: carboxymuconolactone decarboxylase family protein, partial [Gammaproteobacteria bacterium]
MRLDAPRIPPLPDEAWSVDVQQQMAPFVRQGRVFNIFRTLANHPDLMRRWLVFGNHILGKSTLPARERELVILR